MRFTIYSLAIVFLLLQIVNCEKNKHCRDDEHCLVNQKPKNNKNSYETTYKKKYESYAAARSSETAKKAEDKDCSKRKYQLNCSKSWKKAKNGAEESTKNSKVYIKRENNPLLNLDNDDGDLRKKKKQQQKVEQRKGKPATIQEKQNKKKVQLEKAESSSEEDESDNEWW